MDKQNTEKKDEVLQKKRRRNIWKRIVSVMACVVVFCTTYALILPAITMSNDVFCGLEEHAHTDNCYEKILICGINADQADEAYEKEQDIESISVNNSVHTHSSECYLQQMVLICDLPETEGHIHNENCQSITKELICGMVEEEGHLHENECYVEKISITCGLEEVAAHIHSDACYETQNVLVCEVSDAQTELEENSEEVASLEGETDLSEDLIHTHVESCYEKKLICNLEEHTHIKMCYSDKHADVETEADWEATLPGESKLTGNWRDDLIVVAKSQIGYEESAKNYEVNSEGDTKGYTRYGAWYGDAYGDWCAMFVSFCLEYAEIDEAVMPRNANCQNWIEILKQEKYDLYREADSDYIPQSGDLIFFEWGDGDANSDHIGIVDTVSVDDSGKITKIKTIEGNSGDAVRYQEYDGQDSQILGYGELPENPLLTHTIEEVRVQKVIDLIDALPTNEEIDSRLNEFDELGDMDGYEAYYKDVYDRVLSTYVLYEDLSDELRAQVINIDKLMELEWLWSASVMANTSDIPVYQTNSFSNLYSAVVFYGKSADDYGVTDIDFNWWTAIVVEVNENGELYVGDIVTTGGIDKSAYGPSSEKGFVLLVWHSRIPVSHLTMKEGDLVNVTFNYTETNSYNEDGYGIITFESPDGNNDRLTIIQGADTRDLITVNLYDYSNNINNPYITDNIYPGFQQDEGQKSVTATYHSNFGNNITADLEAGKYPVTEKNGTTINATVDLNGAGLANSPISGMMSATLNSEGYPALVDGTSLRYLFSGGSGYANKANNQSINGLFLYNDETGAYTFNSRENHAQFNPQDDTFTLYEQLISSNFIWYPFGNFLPFNDIVEQTTQASTISREYFQAIAIRARNKYDQDMGEEYLTLADALESWIALMDATDTTGEKKWRGTDAMNEYFNGTGGPGNKENINFDFATQTELLSKVYSIDYDEATNFYFGMEMIMNFMQPKNGLTGKTGKEEMVFYFTGDDDVWVYVDGVLFLDLSGIHRHVGGEIDFVNGIVKYYSLDVATGDVSTTPYKTQTFAEILTAAGKSTEGLNDKGTFKDYSTHSFNFYYMERGAGSGVCRMNFNFPLLRQNSISVSKEITVDDETILPLLGNPDFKFQILKANEDGTKTEELFIGSNVLYQIYDTDNNLVGTGTTDVNGIFTLKAGQRAEFSDIPENAGKYYVRELLDENTFEQYGKVYVDGNSITTDYNVEVGQDKFKGVESNVKNISDGATIFNFNNQVEKTKLASLAIKKILGEETETEANRSFEFYVTFDNNPIPINTEYKIGDATLTVEKEGFIMIPANETAIISKILAGSAFSVSETEASARGYTVVYSGSEGVHIDGDKAFGVAKPDTVVQIEVTNSENGVNVIIPGVKEVSNPDGIARTVAFKLEQVTDFSGTEEVEEGLKIETEIQVTDSEQFQFNLSYLERNLSELPAEYYYKITEVINDNVVNAFKVDETFYVIEVNVAKNDDTLQAAVTNCWKNGTDKMANTEAMTFTNILLSNLKLEKVVSGRETDELFQFEITLTDVNGDAISGIYVAERTDGSITDITFDSDGKALVELSHQESITIKGIPNGSKWSIEEQHANDYIVSHVIGTSNQVESNVASGDVTVGSNTVTFTNTATYSLPETGGIGVNSYILGGMVMSIMAGSLLLYKNYKRGKEDYDAS